LHINLFFSGLKGNVISHDWGGMICLGVALSCFGR